MASGVRTNSVLDDAAEEIKAPGCADNRRGKAEWKDLCGAGPFFFLDYKGVRWDCGDCFLGNGMKR